MLYAFPYVFEGVFVPRPPCNIIIIGGDFPTNGGWNVIETALRHVMQQCAVIKKVAFPRWMFSPQDEIIIFFYFVPLEEKPYFCVFKCLVLALESC